MDGSQHYTEAERLLSAASFTDFHGNPLDRNGNLLMPGALESLIARAKIHATLAQAAANVLPVITQMCGDSDQVTAWAKAIGWTNEPKVTRRDIADQDDNPSGMSKECHNESCGECPGDCWCLCHQPRCTCIPWDDAADPGCPAHGQQATATAAPVGQERGHSADHD